MILVTGATGHIGNVLVRRLLGSGQAVRALVLPGEDLAPLAGVEVERRQGDVLDPQSLAEAMRGVDVLYHLAAVISILPGRPPALRAINVGGTRNVLGAAERAGVRRLIYASSIHAFERVPHGTYIDESLPFDPANPVGEYDRTKAEASLAVQAAAQAGLDAVIVCPTGVIGPNDFRGSEMGRLIRDCVQGRHQLYVDGAYDFVDVRDVAEGLLLAAAKGRRAETYILSGERLTVSDVLDILWEGTGRRFPRTRIPFWVASGLAALAAPYGALSGRKTRLTPYSLATLRSNSAISHAKATRELGYRPRPLRETLEDTIAWFTAAEGSQRPGP
jgi:dihydroflavonol-4-reductase